MAFGIYVHIPYCLQRCVYCDFATFELNDSRVGPTDEYVELLCQEIQRRHQGIISQFTQVDTLYFGGGTPSLLNAKDILTIKNCLSQVGFKFSTQLECTIEINPATIDPEKLKSYLEIGINRFSLGVQSFNDENLKRAGRKHNADQTRATLELLKDQNLNMDLLFALPHQSLEMLEEDLKEFMRWRPKHISPYCLTVPSANPMSANRPTDDNQVEMFQLIRKTLCDSGYSQYEISNYAIPGYESRHNNLYWEDQNYWGIGLSSHSFLKTDGYGVRFWNPSQYKVYKEQVVGSSDATTPFDHLPATQVERLKEHEALTDFCHTALRTSRGLNRESLREKFSSKALELIESRLYALPRDWLAEENNRWILTHEGQVLSNKVFEQLYVAAEDV